MRNQNEPTNCLRNQKAQFSCLDFEQKIQKEVLNQEFKIMPILFDSLILLVKGVKMDVLFLLQQIDPKCCTSRELFFCCPMYLFK